MKEDGKMRKQGKGERCEANRRWRGDTRRYERKKSKLIERKNNGRIKEK